MQSSNLIIKSIHEMQKWIESKKSQNPKFNIGFVPTMGALHQGHISLIEKSNQQNDFTVVSIFINPTQFNNPDDLIKYPKTLHADLELINKNAKVDVVFCPTYEELYVDQYRYKMTESLLSKRLCGAHRPGHFDGVLSVVLKLFLIVRPNQAYFGEKDYQQFLLIKGLVESYFLNITLVPCPTIREPNGLAMSSRNSRLSKQGFENAHLIYKMLSTKYDISEIKQVLNSNGFEIEYIEDFENRRFIAVHLEGVRLIDNIEVQKR